MKRSPQECWFLAGLVAGEGCFYRNEKTGFAQFTVGMHVRDIAALDRLRDCIECGTVAVYPSRPTMARYQVCARSELVQLVIPFFERYLRGTYKAEQFMFWRALVLADYRNALTRKRDTYQKRRRA